MKIPVRILKVVSGPILAATAFGCSTNAPTVPEPAPVTPAPIVVTTSADPVRYDASVETERLARTADLLREADDDRTARIDDEEAAADRRRLRGGIIGLGQGGLGNTGIPPQWNDVMAACGRG
jgi:hypothetical protein